MIELYHFPFSTCSQKVRLVLAEKELDFVSHEIDLISGGQHDPAYVKLNPNHVVPTLVDDGTVLIESTLINEYLDDAYPQTPMRPAAPVRRHALRLWTKLLDEKVHSATAMVTYAMGPRTILLQQSPEEREANLAAIPDPKARAARRSVVEHGVKAPEFAGALAQMIDLLDRMDAGLADDDWLSGDSYGLADAAALPYVLRLDHLAMTPLLSASARPRLAGWYERARKRPSFETAVAKWAPEEVLAFLRNIGEGLWPDVEPITASGRVAP
jgi:glutathione S-transferase